MQERPGFERSYQLRWRRKSGLEPPLQGRWSRENVRLVFAPPTWYDALVIACIVLGPIAGVWMARNGVMGDATAFALGIGILVCFAGLWAALSNERMLCELRKRTYVRLEGQGFGKRIERGSLDELDALVLTAEEYPVGALVSGRMVVYRLVIYWKGSAKPPLVAESQYTPIPVHAPLQFGAGRIAQRGQAYAQGLNLPFYNNAYFHSSGPLPPI